MQFITKKVTHVDGKTIVNARGLIRNGVFTGEYKFAGMTYGVTIPVSDKEVTNGK